MVAIDQRLLSDGEVLGKFTLCHVLLMRDANYPWLVLVPDREGAVEVFDLSEEDQKQLNMESTTLLQFLKKEFSADKMNVAALGNIVSQLHVHHIVRYKNDIAWPAPIWGAVTAKTYSDEELKALTGKLKQKFATLGLGFSE